MVVGNANLSSEAFPFHGMVPSVKVHSESRTHINIDYHHGNNIFFSFLLCLHLVFPSCTYLRPSLRSSDPLFVCFSLAPSKRIHFQGRGSEDIQRQLIKKKEMTSIRQNLQTPSSKRTLNLSRLRRS